MTVRSLYPADRPNLLLNFAKAKALDTRVSLTRASTGTYVGADGLIKTAKVNEARFDSNPTTGAGLGLMVEPARTNYASQSLVAINATLISSNDTTYQPLQGASVYKFSIGSSGLQFYVPIFNAPGYSTTELFDTVTFYLRSDSPVTVTSDYNGVPSSSGINFSNGTTASYSHTVTQSASVLGFTRYAITYLSTQVNGNTITRAQINVSGTAGTNFYVFGAQWESRASLPTSYIPTAGSTVTRAADVVTLEEPYFSNLWNPSGGTFLVDYTTPAAGTSPIISVDNNTTSNRIELYTSGTSQKFTVTSGGATQCDLTTGTVAANTIYRLSAAYASNDFSSVLNGATPVTASAGTVPTANRLRIGSNQAGDYAVSTFARIAYYPNRYPNTQLQGLTTT